jgi:hypothetical protein
MKTRIVLLVVTVMLSITTFAAEPKPNAPSGNANAAFEKLKALVGEWEADSNMGKIQARYELVSDGHVLVEHLTIAGVHDNMVTTYYLDGDKLGLTHYCAAGNQPRMESKGINADGTIRFDFAGAANLASPRDKHMHSVLVHLIDNDHFTSDWTLFDGGKAKMTVAPQYARVK